VTANTETAYWANPVEDYEDAEHLKAVILPRLKNGILDLVAATGDSTARTETVEPSAPASPAPFMDWLSHVTEHDANTLSYYRSKLRPEVRQRMPPDLADTQFLSRSGFVRRSRLTNAGMLLFSNAPGQVLPQAVTRCTLYQGNSVATERDRKDLVGPLFRQIEEAHDFIAITIGKRERPSPHAAAAEVDYQYPMICLRELIANAVCHRDYESERMTYLRVFPDRIEIHSPGAWMIEGKIAATTSIEQLIAKPVPRNLRVARAIADIDIVEIEGSGLRASVDDCLQHEAPLPQVVETDGYVCITVFPRLGWSSPSQRSHSIASGPARGVGGAHQNKFASTGLTAATESGTLQFLNFDPSPGNSRQESVREGPDSHAASIGPRYPDDETRRLSERLEEAHARKQRLLEVGADSTEVMQELLLLRRQIREGGQLRAGDSLGDGRYLLLQRIGRGGFAIVWRAVDRQTDQHVAIKVLHTELAGDPVRRDRFFRGARAMASIEDDAIVRILEPHGEDGGYHYFVMDLVPGGDLHHAILEKRIAADAVLDIVLRVSDVLAVAHARGLVHRDVKPANILIDAAGSPKLTDFDLVGGADTTGGTRTGAMGSFIYAAPELLHQPQNADARADVYGLGMTAVFALRGAELDVGTVRDAATVIANILCEPAVREVLKQAVAWDPSERHENAAEFGAALRVAREN
jgi:hypothetical protein